MDLEGAGRLGVGGDGADGSRSGRRASASIASAIVVLFLCSSVSAAAPVVTLDPVEPGVPGHGRAWELVTPPDVVPGQVSPSTALSRSGNRVVYFTVGTLPGAPYGVIVTHNMAERGPDGWTNRPVAYPHPELTPAFGGGEGPVAYDPELGASIAMNTVSSPPGGLGLFTGAPDGTYAPLVDMGVGSSFVAASEDLQRVVFESADHLLPADASRLEGASLYEFDGSTLSLIDVDNGGSLISACGATVAAVSADAEQVFFTARDDCPNGPTRVYLRAGGETTEISDSQCTLPDCGSASEVTFVGRAANGSSAFLATAERLTDDDANADQDIYRYDVDSGELTLLYARPPAATATSVTFPMHASSDGSRAFFLAEGELLPGQGQEAGRNLYLADDQGLHFVAPVAKEGFEVSPDGRYVLFLSSAPLTGGDSDESVDLYRYDVVADAHARISTGLGGGGNGPFDASLPTASLSTGDIVGDVGRRVLFETAEQLVPQDRNEAADLYEWTEAGLALVSAGTPGIGGKYLGATADGRTVLFRTNATLLGRDRDGGEADIYAARVGGGFVEATAPASCEEEETCPVAPPPRPVRRSPVGAGGERRIWLAQIDAATRRRLVAKGSAGLLAEVPEAGHISARGRARVKSNGLTVATGSAEAKQAGPIRLLLRLTPPARRALTLGHDLRVRLTLRGSKGEMPLKTGFTLRGAS
jgi:hypothetical protein